MYYYSTNKVYCTCYYEESRFILILISVHRYYEEDIHELCPCMSLVVFHWRLVPRGCTSQAFSYCNKLTSNEIFRSSFIRFLYGLANNYNLVQFGLCACSYLQFYMFILCHKYRIVIIIKTVECIIIVQITRAFNL